MINPMYTNLLIIPGWLFFLIVIAAAFTVFGLTVRKRARLIMTGGPDDRSDQPSLRLRNTISLIFGQRTVLREGYPGILHLLVFYGFVVLLTGNVFLFGEAFFPKLGEFLEETSISGIVTFLVELFIVLVYIGLGMAAWRRYIIKPDRLDESKDAGIILIFIFWIVTFALLMDIFKSARIDSAWEGWAFIAAPIGNALSSMSPGALDGLYVFSFWVHLLLILIILVYLPFSKHMHFFVCPFNEYYQKLSPKGVPPYIDIDEAEEFGAERIEQFSWKQIMDLFCCVECGRCQDGCPAYNTGKPLSPKKLVIELRDYMLTYEKQLLADGKTPEDAIPMVGETIEEDVIWSCTSCGYCEEHCPFFIEHLEKVGEMRRYMVSMTQMYPKELNKFFKNLEVHGNPWEIGWQKRADWVKDADVPIAAEVESFDILYWIGCAGSYNDRSKKVSRAMVSLLKKAGVNFAILGNEERCTGDSARSVGNEMLFQVLAEMNIEVLNRYGVKKIVTHCPHCMHTLKHEYPRFGGEYEVVHHADFLLQLVKDGKLNPKAVNGGKIVYHDSCLLGRYNDIYDEPRELLRSTGADLVEMEKTGDKSFCCGAGGGRMWMEEDIGDRINIDRARQAADTGASSIATACPYCLTMLEDGIADISKQDEMDARDIAEILDATC